MIDCTGQQTRPLQRDPFSKIDSSGVTLIGQTLKENIHFEGDIQQIYIIPSPDSAYEQCYEYIPDCDTPFPYEENEDSQVDNEVEENGEENHNTTGLNGFSVVGHTDDDDEDDELTERTQQTIITTYSTTSTTTTTTTSSTTTQPPMTTEEDYHTEVI